MLPELAYSIFEQSINDYHVIDNVSQPESNPYKTGSFEHLLYTKNWIDTLQWHCEDMIRDPQIDPVFGLELKRKIDSLNQERINVVERIDHHFLHKFANVKLKADAKINTESPAWALDRLSILALKIYHMQIESVRQEASPHHREKCRAKLLVLLEQKNDLLTSITQLIEDIQNGDRYMKVYKQMKMYNDEELNPVLYAGKLN